MQKRGRKQKTDEVEDGVIVGMAKHLYKESYEKLTVVLNDENICPDIKQNISKWTVFQRCKEAGARSARPLADVSTKTSRRMGSKKTRYSGSGS